MMYDVIFLQEVARLNVNKLEVLRQKVAAQREVKRLREWEVQPSSDLSHQNLLIYFCFYF